MIFSNRLNDLAVTPLKYLMGDFGGAGIIRTAAVLLSLYHQLSLPALKAEILKQKPHGVLNWDISTKSKIQTALMTTSTFGGGSSSLVFTRNS